MIPHCPPPNKPLPAIPTNEHVDAIVNILLNFVPFEIVMKILIHYKGLSHPVLKHVKPYIKAANDEKNRKFKKFLNSPCFNHRGLTAWEKIVLKHYENSPQMFILLNATPCTPRYWGDREPWENSNGDIIRIRRSHETCRQREMTLERLINMATNRYIFKVSKCDMVQYCKDNKIRGYSKFKRDDLVKHIFKNSEKYEFV